MRRTILHPRTLQPLRPLGYRKDGRVIWPILGGSEPPQPPPAPAPPSPAPPPAPPAPPADRGFPENTPLEQMTVEQREAYWKHQSRKHEERVKAYGGLTPEQITELRDKAAKHDALEHELMSDKDKAVAEARQAAANEAAAKHLPRLVRAEFRAELKGRVPDDQLDERLTTIVEPLDLNKFLTEAGDVDTAKVTAFVSGIAPATGTTPPPRTGPSSGGAGRSGTYETGDSTVAAGRERYRQKHAKRSA